MLDGGVWCGVWSVKRGVESEVWSGDCEVARVECVKCGVWSLMWEVWNVKRGVESVKGGVRSVGCFSKQFVCS